mgnify:CR=1 FL=1
MSNSKARSVGYLTRIDAIPVVIEFLERWYRRRDKEEEQSSQRGFPSMIISFTNLVKSFKSEIGVVRQKVGGNNVR